LSALTVNGKEVEARRGEPVPVMMMEPGLVAL